MIEKNISGIFHHAKPTPKAILCYSKYFSQCNIQTIKEREERKFQLVLYQTTLLKYIGFVFVYCYTIFQETYSQLKEESKFLRFPGLILSSDCTVEKMRQNWERPLCLFYFFFQFLFLNQAFLCTRNTASSHLDSQFSLAKSNRIK